MDTINPDREYEIVALRIPIVYNKYGYHDRDGMLFALKKNVGELKNIHTHFQNRDKNPGFYHPDLHTPHPLARPLVLRARKGETIRIKLQNEIKDRKVGLHLVSNGYSVITSDGAHVGVNPPSLVAPSDSDHPIIREYIWDCRHEGVFVFHDMGDVNGDEDASNAHGLFGALVVEPENAEWTDSETGEFADDGLYVDVHPKGKTHADGKTKQPWLSRWPDYYADNDASFREYVIFIHDEGDVKKPEGWWVKDSNNNDRYIFENDPKIPLDRDDPENHIHEGLPKDPCAVELGCKAKEHDGENKGEHGDKEITPCDCAHVMVHDAEDEALSAHVMPISYRGEPMGAREMELWHRICKNNKLPCPNIVNEEQHHSSWAFGDPDTPILKAYIGDPVRIRLVHAGVKETHIYHLHFYQWHHVPYNVNTPILDSITISPQTGHTIVPLWGAGGPHGVAADVIWHCHLYPHFHEGMWGLFRTFDRCHLVESGEQKDNFDFSNHYPDGSPIKKLQPLPDREAPPLATKKDPGFPGFMVDLDFVENKTNEKDCATRGGKYGEKSPVPPWPYAVDKQQADKVKAALGIDLNIKAIPADLEYRPATLPELAQMYRYKDRDNIFNTKPEPGWVFPTFAAEIDPKGNKLERKWFELDVKQGAVVYNQHGYHDKYGHFYTHEGSGDGAHPREFQQAIEDPGNGRCECPETSIPPISKGDKHSHEHKEANDRQHECKDGERHVPLFIRANKGDFVTLSLANRLPFKFDCNPFDMRQPRCDTLGKPTAECGIHVHLVKFDVLTADGASSGWNYMSGPTPGKRMMYKWQVDEEFGVCFFHDHCFANYRQRHGLFGALIAEPKNAVVVNPANHEKEIRHGIEAVVKYPNGKGQMQWFREFCFGLQDFVPLFTRQDHPLHKPEMPGDHGDNGWMALNYRCEPLLERLRFQGNEIDPAEWFSSKLMPEPSTDIFHTYPGEPIRLRLVQGSHEEQHSFQVHGLRWHRFRNETNSPWRNQQTLGISEAFTFNIAHQDAANPYYPPGDYLWKSTASDDLWCGVWGYIRALANKNDTLPSLPNANKPAPVKPVSVTKRRRFKVVACKEPIVYRPAHNGQRKLHDPNGLLFKLVEMTEPNSKPIPVDPLTEVEPLVLRCRVGEWVEVEVHNQLPENLLPEPWSPLSPEEVEKEFEEKVEKGEINPTEVPILKRKKVSSRVSLHADLLSYDVQQSDGSNVGNNPDQTMAPGETRTYLWYADVLGPVLLQDMADVKNHRHHGLVGALVVEPQDAEPFAVDPGEVSTNGAKSAWYGTRATVKFKDGSVKEEKVLLLQDGLRLFWESDDPNKPYKFPMYDLPADPGEAAPDFEDQGNKAINYRCEPLGQFLKLHEKPEPNWLVKLKGYLKQRWPQGLEIICSLFPRFAYGCDKKEKAEIISKLSPANPMPHILVAEDADVVIHLIGACDKGRNHSFTVHGHAWEEWPGLQYSPMLGAAGGISGGLALTLNLHVSQLEKADYAIRSGVYRWALNEGVWGILRRK